MYMCIDYIPFSVFVIYDPLTYSIEKIAEINYEGIDSMIEYDKLRNS